MIFLPIEGAGRDTPLLWKVRSTAHGRGARQTSQRPAIPNLRLLEGAAVPYGLANQRQHRRAARSSA